MCNYGQKLGLGLGWYDSVFTLPSTRMSSSPILGTVNQRLQFEALVAELSARFVNLPPDKVDGVIEDSQRQIVEALDIDRATLWEVSIDGTELRPTHYWARPGLPVATTRLVAGDDFPWITSRLMRGETVTISSLHDLPPGTRDRESLHRVGTKSTVTVPLLVGGRLVGAAAFAAMREKRTWSDDLVNRLRLVAQVFANVLSRKRSDEEVRGALAEVSRLRDRLKDENEYLKREVDTLHGEGEIVGDSPALRSVLDQVRQVAPTGATVLLLGETGTGKELIASQIHELSTRRSRMMVRVNCAAIPGALIESELFGREKGAYTGALSRQIGRFELADQSTLFLDEIGDLSLDVQVKLLRALQERVIERLGSSKPISLDVRIIAATHHDLESGVAKGTFREDLYYRLNVFPITIPPLRDRPEDIPALVWRCVDECCKTFGKQVDSIPKSNMLALQRYAWPGNVRELRNVVERAVIVAQGPRLAIDLPNGHKPFPASHPKVKLVDVERDHICGVLESAGWRIRGSGGAAELLGMKPSTLESRMAKLGLRRPPQ
jgi:formate hydrogenlyase transcriptional activator